MFGMSMTEMIFIVIFALLILGPKELPNVAKTIGKTLREVRKATDDLRETFDREVMQDKPTPRPQPVAEAVAQAPAAPQDALPPVTAANTAPAAEPAAPPVPAPASEPVKG